MKAAQETNAEELYLACKNYINWIDNDFRDPVDEKILFNMGKCQGIVESVGKTMYTLCIERARNLDIPKQITANIGNMKTRKLIRAFVYYAEQSSNLAGISAYTFLLKTYSKRWAC